MMMCLKDLLLYVVLLPIPSASPLLIGLYWLAVVLSIRPCGYCIALFIIIYLTTSPSSPFLTIPAPQLPINPLKPLTSPLPDRSWLTWNNGAWWDPAIVGYTEIASVYQKANDHHDSINNQTTRPDEVRSASLQGESQPASSGSPGGWWSRSSWRQTAVSSPSADPAPTASSDTISAVESPSATVPLPANYFDLRWAGIGFVLDVGLTRSEEGMKWELADAKRAVARKASHDGGEGNSNEAKGAGQGSGDKRRAAPSSASKDTSGIWSVWDSVSFLGSW